MIAPYVLFLILFIRVISLKGSLSGIAYMMIPRMNRLLDPTVWFNALGQSFFQIGIGFGTLSTFACFRNKNFKIQISSTVLVLTNFGSSLLSACIVFGYLGFFSELTNIPIDDLPISGSSLVFVTYPASLVMMPWPRFWLAIFFFTMILLTIDSQLGFLECVSYFFIELQNRYNNVTKE